ncbi:MAG: putative glycoside hydrolase [Actinomycetota bacterium]|nr:putative glycoside hydrolase [Actinomycetota bacterium]
MPTDLLKIPGVDPPKRRLRRSRHRDAWTLGPAPVRAWPFRLGLPSRRRWAGAPGRGRGVSWASVALGAGYAALGLYGVAAFWSATRVDVAVEGVVDRERLTSAALADRALRFNIDRDGAAEKATLRLDGRAVPDDDRQVEGATVVWRPGDLPEGEHRLELAVPRPLLGDSKFLRRFVVDDTPPPIEVPALLPAVGVCEPVVISGRSESGAALTLDGAPVPLDGDAFTLRYSRPPAAPLHLVARDRAGNESRAEVIVPVRYPGGHGVHVTAAAWGFEPIRRGVLGLIDAGLISTVQLDLKDESGVIGFDSQLPLAVRVGAVRPEYRLKDALAELERRGVRVIGRIVAFRDAPLARWAWENDRRDWVVQDAAGGMLSTYGGFTNPAHPDVHRYNVDIAVEAADAGVDDILWDYVRRPEGDPASMVIPGLVVPGGRQTTSDAVVEFLASAGTVLRERCVHQGASVFGIAADRPDAVGQDVPRISRHVDYVAPMLYPSHWVPGEYDVANPNRQPFDIVKAALADFQAKTAGTGRPLVPWLQDFSLGHPYGAPEVRAQITAAAAVGVRDWLLWNAGARYTAGALEPGPVRTRS